MSTTYDITAEQGSYLSISLVYRDASGNLVNLTGATASMQVRRRQGAQEAFLRLSSSGGTTTGITLGTTNGAVNVYVSDEALSLIAPGTYVYDLEVNPVGGAMVKLISGLFTVAGEVTR
jgi:hypothetical protein